ncbi:cysteine repeat modular protein, putative [Eimeria praecox]|uniref:Cysteine repeat modular protein, putative n=1 Tax=Eimeria praecox TaxID=51316 RepID=U6H6I0_9EIME|nr:cysteine repeat modular protein, putative [Eimeria praecox]
MSAEGGDSVTSLLEIIEGRKKNWARTKTKEEGQPHGIHCSSAVYGQINAGETVVVNPEEAPNCRNLCRALLHKHGGTCEGASDPYTCLLEHRSERWFPQVYRERCMFTRPSLQQPDFEHSSCSKDCLHRGMTAWLTLLHRGDLSWDSFLEKVPSSCTFKRVDIENSADASSGGQAESAIVPGEYWEGLGGGEKRRWAVSSTFYAPADEQEVLPLVQRLTGSSTGQAICLFREQQEQDGARGRFGMVPGRSCAGSIGVLYVLALEARPPPGFDGASQGFDLCVAHRVFKDEVMAEDSAVEVLRLRTRVTVGTPCGVARGLDKGLWEATFYAARYPQARGVEGFPTGGDCPWRGALQLGAKCFLKTRERRDNDNFFSANAHCRNLAEAVGFDHDDASLAVIESDRELNLVRPAQCPLVVPGVGASCRRKEGDCPKAALTSPDKLGNRLSAIIGACTAARTWPPWKPVHNAHSKPLWDPTFCDGQPQALDGEKFADCASLTQQGTGPPCLRARSCDASFASVCSLRLRTGPRILSKGNRGTRDLPLVLCGSSKDCWLSLEMPIVDWWGETMERRPNKDHPFPLGFLGVMGFCGDGALLAGPWQLQPQINIWKDTRLKGLPAGVYEVCYCSPVRVGDSAVSCVEGKEFRFLRALLQLDSSSGTTSRSSPVSGTDAARTTVVGLPSVSFRPLQGPAAAKPAASGVWLEALPSELGFELVFCKVGADRRTDSSCRFTLHSAEDTEVPVALLIAPVREETKDSAALCTQPGITVAVSVKGKTEVEVPSFLPTSLKYSICGNGSLLGTLIASAKFTPGPDARSEGFSFAQSSLTLNFPDGKINNAFLNVTVEGYSSGDLAGTALLAVLEAQTEFDTRCNTQLNTAKADGVTYPGDFDDDQQLLIFTVPAPTVRSKLCLYNRITEYFTDIISLGQAPVPTRPETVSAREGRCSLAPKGDCVIGLYPDSTTIDQPWEAFYPSTVAVKLLKGKVNCPDDPSHPDFDVFAGDPEDTAALLKASAVAMTLTDADSSKVMFSVAPKLKRWVADAEIATICMTQEGLKNPTETCWESGRCTQRLGYMRWTGPTAGYDQFFMCHYGQPCKIEIRGVNMSFVSMHYSRLAALDICGKVSGEGSLPLLNAFGGVDLSLPSDDASFLQISSAGALAQEGAGGVAAGPPSSFEALEERAEQVSGTVFQEMKSTVTLHTSTAIFFELNATTSRDSLQLCWNPSVGSMHNLLDHTVSVGRVLFLPRPSLQSVKLPPVLFQQSPEAVTLTVSAQLKPLYILGSSRVYFKRAPTEKDVDACNYVGDARGGVITAYMSVTAAKETDDGQTLGTVVAAVQQEASSICWAHFFTPSSFAADSVNASYLGRLPGVELPSSTLEVICSLDTAANCTATGILEPSSVLGPKGQVLQSLSMVPSNMSVAAVPQDACPLDPGDIDFSTPTDEQGLSPEQVVSSFTSDRVTVTVERDSRILGTRGSAALCIIDNDCINPDSKSCVKSLGTAKWIGPTQSTATETLCEQLEAGRCRVTISGFQMNSLDYSVPRLALSSNCYDPDSTPWHPAENEAAEEGAATFLVPAVAGFGYKLCWNSSSSPGSTTDFESVPFKANFSYTVSSVTFLPLPVVRALTVSRKSPFAASVIIEVSALLDETTAKAFGGRVPAQGLWSSISADTFTDGSSCSSGSKLVTLHKTHEVKFEKVLIRNRQDGSSVETGTDGTEGTVAIMSLEVQATEKPTTYCWTTVIFGGKSAPVRKTWTPLVSVSGPASGQLGGSISSTALALGFVPCMASDTETSACVFGVTAGSPNDPALFPVNEPWILPEQSSVFLLPGEAECPDENSALYDSAVGLEDSELNFGSPLSLSAEPISDDEVVEYMTYRFGSGRAWLSQNGSSTICWRDDGTRKSTKIGQALWGKNLTKLDHSFSRLAILQRCGAAKGLGTAQLRSAKVGASSFLILGSSTSGGFLTEEDLEPVHFWALSDKFFRTRCKQGTATEFVEAKWVDLQGVCGQMDVADLLNAYCEGKTLCFFMPVAHGSSEPTGDTDAALQVTFADTCGDTGTRKLFGMYRCVENALLLVRPLEMFVLSLVDACSDVRNSSADEEHQSAGELDEGVVMMELSTNAQVRHSTNEGTRAGLRQGLGSGYSIEDIFGSDENGSAINGSNSVAGAISSVPEETDSVSDESTSISGESDPVSDESISFWAPQGSPGLYEICWNPQIIRNDDPSAYSESLGIIEVRPVLSIVDEAVVCSGTELSTCTFQLTVAAQENMGGNRLLGLLIEDQDGTPTCTTLTEEQLSAAVVLPHQSAWTTTSSLTELTYSTQLPPESRKLCVVAMDTDLKTFGTPQYVGNIPGSSAPAELLNGQGICLVGDKQQCEIKIAPEKVSKYYALDNRSPDEDETSPSFDAFANLEPHLDPSSSLYAFEGDVACPESSSDEMYVKATEAISNGVTKLTLAASEIDGLTFRLTTEQNKWLTSSTGVTLCWALPSCSGDPLKNGSRPCTKRVGMLTWAGPVVKKPLPTIRCRLDQPCAFVVAGVKLASMSHEMSRVAFVKSCGSSEGPGIGIVTEFPQGYTSAAFEEGWASQPSFVERKSRRPRRRSSYPAGRRKQLPRLEDGIVSLLQQDDKELLSVDSMTVISPLPVDDSLAICWNGLREPTDRLEDFTLEIGKAVGYGVSEITAFCVSGSVCGIDVITKGSFLAEGVLKIQAFNGICGDEAAVALELPDGGRFRFSSGTTYSFSSPIRAEGRELAEYELCWCDTQSTPECNVTDYTDNVGSLLVQSMEELLVMCIRDSGAVCTISLPAIMERDSLLYISKLTSSSPDTCTTPLYLLPTKRGFVLNDQLEITVAFSSLEVAGLVGMPLAICWTEHANIAASSIPAWSTSFIGRLVFIDSKASSNTAYAGVPPIVRIDVIGWGGDQAAQDSLPLSLQQLYLKEKGTCASADSSIAVPLTVQSVEAVNGGTGIQITFGTSEVIELVVLGTDTSVHELSLCWCYDDLMCANPEDFDIEILRLSYWAPASGVSHECTYDTTCLLGIRDMPMQEFVSFLPQLLIRSDCADDSVDEGLPNGGRMSVRLTAANSGDLDTSSAFEWHMYGFTSLVNRELALGGLRQVQKMICYCTDSTTCTPDRLVNIGQLTIRDVWNTEFRVSLVQRIKLPFTVSSPLKQQDSGRKLVVTRGESSLPCVLEQQADVCTVSFQDFPADTLSSPAPATLQYYDSSLPQDAVDTRPVPYVAIASLVPAGPWKADYTFLCLIGGSCEVTIDIVNWRAEDKVALLSQCGNSGTGEVGLNQISEAVDGSDASVVFRWTNRLELSASQMKKGLELCWKAVEDAGSSLESISDYSAKFGTVSIAGVLPNQDASCYVGQRCRAEGLKAQNISGSTHIAVLKGGCGQDGTEWGPVPNGGIMVTDIVKPEKISVSFPGRLPVMDIDSLVMCGCSERECTTLQDYGWRIGNLLIKGPVSHAPHLEVFATSDIRLSLVGTFDDGFYLVLKEGVSCESAKTNPSWNLQGFSPITNGNAAWAPFDTGKGPLSVCICHDKVAGLSDPFGHPSEVLAHCERASNYAVKVGQIFVNGPIRQDAEFTCRSGSICTITLQYIAVDSEATREQWAASQVYAQEEDCSVAGTVLQSGGAYISDTRVGEQTTLTDPNYPIVYETRESAFMFHDLVELGAGVYNLCWKQDGATTGVSLGSFNIHGPLTAQTVLPVVIGQKFSVEIPMNSIIVGDEADNYRIRAYAYKGSDIFNNFSCKQQTDDYSSPAAFGCAPATGPPTAVKDGELGSILIWEDVCVIVDELYTAALAGDKYAVCFCDGNLLGCETADRFQLLVQAWELSGPKPLQQDVLPRYRAGVRFSLNIEGVNLIDKPVIMLSPALDPLSNNRFTCQSDGKPQMRSFVGTVSADRALATFADIYVPFTISQGLFCWCPGGDCLTANDFTVQLGRFGVTGPTFIAPRVVVGSYFSVQLIGQSLSTDDAISIRGPTDICGDPGTEDMDPDLVMEEENRTLNSLGTVESFSVSENSVSGDTEMIWTSWGIRIKTTVQGYMKICYCPSTEQECDASGSKLVLAGELETRGPSKGGIELIASEEYGEYLVVRGTNLSNRNLLRYFQYTPLEGTAAAEQEADICSNSHNLSGGVTTFPDAVNAAGTEQYFSVTVSVGKQYAACWSFGDAAASRATSMSRSRAAPSFISADDLISVRRSLIEKDSSGPSEDPASDQYVVTSSDDRSSLDLESRKWFFVSLFSQTGFQQGVHNVVIGHEDNVVIGGVINATDTYEVALGLNRDMSECSEIFELKELQSDIGITTVSVSESRMVLQIQAAQEQGWHKICIKNKTASLIFDAGTVEVTSHFQKSGMDMYDTQRTFVLPCLTGTKNSLKQQVREFPQVWLPDGTGLWTAKVVVGVPRTTKEYSTLQVKSSPKENFVEFPQLRNVLACDTTKDQVVLVLGATRMLLLYPDSARGPTLINHGVPYPADLTHAGDQVFITSFDSHLITSFSLANPSKIIFYEPTNPTLLSAGGIQAITNIDGNETSIFVADTVGGIIGRLKILPDDLDKTAHGGKVIREWTAVFGKQKSDFRNTEGVNRPFCVAEFVTPYSTQENMNSLLVVGELISDRITFLSIDNKGISFYRQITLGVTKFITGLRIIDEVLLLTSKQWSVEQELGRAEVAYITLSQLIDNVYFTYPDFSKKLQAGLRYRFLPLVTGQEIQFFKEDAEAGDPLQSIGFTLDSKTGEIQGTLTATVTSRVVIVGGDLLGSYTWSFEFEAGCQSGEYFNETSNKCEPCPLGTFRDEETELQRCQDHKAYSTTLQTGSTNLSQCTCIEGYEIGLLGYCQPCPAGTYKAIAADAKCTGRCPQHMYSGKTGAASLEDLNCQCEPGFYLTENGCESCQVGTYCEGDLSPPVQCPAFQTTPSSASSKFSDCVCIAGYYRDGDECVPCDVLTYKPLIGDQGCTQCPQPALSVVASSELLATSAPGTSMFSSRRGSTQQSECEVCASGYYFDAVSMGGCVPCKEDFYCPGFQLGMIACKDLSITAGIGAESVFQCKCVESINTPGRWHLLHIDGSETECMPCPSNSMTKSTKSSSITNCVALPGYGALENLQALSNRAEGSDTDDSTTNTFLEAIELAKDVEKAYESLYAEDLLAINVFCKEDISSIQEYDMAEFVTMQYALSFAECQAACLKNVYCTSFSFSKEDRFPTHTNSVMNYTGIYFYSFWPCHLYMFGSAAAADVENWADTWEGTDVEPGKGVGCVVGRVKDELTWQRFRYVECPQNAYCPGDKDASIFECQDYAVTLSTGAYSREHCLCVPGREPVGHMCEQCKLGFYKNATENIACTECPQFFTTSITASTSAYECTCQAGMYMALPGSTEDAEQTEQTKQIEQTGQAGNTEQTGEGLEPPSPASLEPAALETVVHARSIRELGRHAEMEAISPGGVSMLQLRQLPWLEEETREQLEKVVELGVCVPCHTGMFCPGHWKDPPTNSTHMPPQQCIEGSSVPQSTVNADSVEKCLCLAGYAYGRSSDAAVTSDSYFTCSKCPPGTYKELQENSPCSGRCMKDAETYPGAVSKSQCFCQVGRYAVETDDSEGMFSCVECITGGVCVGGFKQSVIKAIEENPSYTNITIADHTTPYPQKGWFATFKTNADKPWRPNWLPFTADFSDETSGVFDLAAGADENGGAAFVQNTQYDRVPDIHPCPVDYRCHGGPSNACAEGGSGYLCSTCEKGYDISSHGGVCTKCQPIWFEVVYLITSRLVLCVIAWLIAAVSCLAVRNPACIHPILIRIWLSNLFVFFLFGFFPENSVSALVDWAPMYRAVFTYPIFIFTKYPKVFCILDELGFPLDFKKCWYLQRFAQMLVPVLDVCITTVICGIALILYKLYRRSKIQRVALVLRHAQEVHAGDIWAMRTVEKIQDMRCLGLFHYISPAGATRSQKILRFFGDLVPAFMVIWFWNLPFLVIECTQLLGCVSISYKDEPAMYFLTALPEQECSLSEPWFVGGAILGSSGILVWGIGSVIVFCVWMLYTDNADKLEARFRYGFLSNGYEFQYRAWEMFLMARKLACACLLTLQLHMSASGTQEVFRNSVNLLIVTMCLIIQLLIEPYDRRSHNLTNRVEFMGLLTNVINCIIIQGSFSFPIFKWLGPLPIVLCGLFHLYVFWNLFVEAGRMVLMRPHLARLPSPWRYFNLVTRSLARLYTRGHAKVYYNYMTNEMVLEAAAKSRVFHIRRMIQRKKKLTDYRKINYENRTYFVSALTDSLSRLVISWCQFTIPGDWLDFTIRYAFCYCFWMRHRAASNREPLDLEEFDAMRPSLFNECYVEGEDGDDDGALEQDTQCNEVEEEFLDMLVDDDVYDDSPITLMELYVAVQSMRYIPKGQLRRLHMRYRERMAAASSSDMPALRKENEELEAELQQLSEVLRNRFGSPGGGDVSFNILDFFFAVEILHEAEAENARIRKDIDKEITSILNARAARSMAERVQMELEKTDGEELEDILRTFDEAAERQTEAKARLEYLEAAVEDSKRKVKSRRKPSKDLAQKRVVVGSRRISLAEERKRILRPSFSKVDAAGGKPSRKSLSPLQLQESTAAYGRTISPVGFDTDRGSGDGSGRRRISVGMGVMGSEATENGVQGKSRRISLSPTPSDAPEDGRRLGVRTLQSHSSLSSDSVGSPTSSRRTVRSASRLGSSGHLSSGDDEDRAPKRTARIASPRAPFEPAEGQASLEQQGSRRRVMRVGSAASSESTQTGTNTGVTQAVPKAGIGEARSANAEPPEGAQPPASNDPAPAAKRSIGLFKRPPGPKEGKK